MSLLTKIAGKYSVKGFCYNCGRIQMIWIPKGISIKEYVDDNLWKCENCGCTDIKIVKEKQKEVN